MADDARDPDAPSSEEEYQRLKKAFLDGNRRAAHAPDAAASPFEPSEEERRIAGSADPRWLEDYATKHVSNIDPWRHLFSRRWVYLVVIVVLPIVGLILWYAWLTRGGG